MEYLNRSIAPSKPLLTLPTCLSKQSVRVDDDISVGLVACLLDMIAYHPHQFGVVPQIFVMPKNCDFHWCVWLFTLSYVLYTVGLVFLCCSYPIEEKNRERVVLILFCCVCIVKSHFCARGKFWIWLEMENFFEFNFERVNILRKR